MIGNLIDNNIWVNANAGSGKTTLLMKRFLTFLLNGINHNMILCITYTNVAADEIKDRILSKILEWSNSSDENLDKELSEFELINYKIKKDEFIVKAKNLYKEIESSNKDFQISTIHSFCYDI